MPGGSVAKGTCSCRGPGLGGSQPSLTPIQGDPIDTNMVYVHECRQNTHMVIKLPSSF